MVLYIYIYELYSAFQDGCNSALCNLISAPDSAFYNWVEGSLVQRVHFSVPSQECVAGVGMQLPLSVKHEYHYHALEDKWLLIEFWEIARR